MSKKVYEEAHIIAIADKIREKTKGDNTYKTSEMPSGIDAVYEAGRDANTPLYYAVAITAMYKGVTFSENYDLAIKMQKTPSTLNETFRNTTGLRSVKFVFDDANEYPKIDLYQAFNTSQDVEVIDFTGCSRNFSRVTYAFMNANKLKRILGAMDLTNCTSATSTFMCYALVDVEFVPNTISCDINFASSNLSASSVESIFRGMTPVETAKTVTFSSKVKILQSQVDSANAKGWTVAGGRVVSEEEYYA